MDNLEIYILLCILAFCPQAKRFLWLLFQVHSKVNIFKHFGYSIYICMKNRKTQVLLYSIMSRANLRMPSAPTIIYFLGAVVCFLTFVLISATCCRATEENQCNYTCSKMFFSVCGHIVPRHLLLWRTAFCIRTCAMCGQRYSVKALSREQDKRVKTSVKKIIGVHADMALDFPDTVTETGI